MSDYNDNQDDQEQPHFKGPGEWRSQAAEAEKDREDDDE